MRVPRHHLLRLAPTALLVLLAVLLASCMGSEQNTLAPAGDVARKQRDIFNLALWPAAVIFVLVEGVLVFALFRYRQRKGQRLPAQVHGNTRLEIAWTIAPTALLLGLAVPMVAAIIDLGRAPAADALQVEVTGFQWNWQFQYPEFKDSQGRPLTIVGTCPTKCAELHIPVDREIGVTLHSADVIHSFWVPKLAGKLDVVPGRTNRLWLNAEEPGTYSGQCAEFCGLGHASMRLTVVAESEEAFKAWVDEQLAGAAGTGAGEPGATRQGESE